MENKKGPNDLEKLLEQRQEEVDMLNKQKEYMQRKCREAAGAVLELEYKVQTLEKDLDRVSEERDNFERMLRSGDDTK
jgi:chromosome segregation ATPase|tara:strand:- start:784 stop:1017 length:234 start_codon:yes stop_codon:yes gene_type:complete